MTLDAILSIHYNFQTIHLMLTILTMQIVFSNPQAYLICSTSSQTIHGFSLSPSPNKRNSHCPTKPSLLPYHPQLSSSFFSFSFFLTNPTNQAKIAEQSRARCTPDPLETGTMQRMTTETRSHCSSSNSNSCTGSNHLWGGGRKGPLSRWWRMPSRSWRGRSSQGQETSSSRNSPPPALSSPSSLGALAWPSSSPRSSMSPRSALFSPLFVFGLVWMRIETWERLKQWHGNVCIMETIQLYVVHLLVDD